MEISTVNLVCLPFAGAGASVFNEWKNLSKKIDVITVQLPGREKRFLEPPYTNIKDAVNSIFSELITQLDFSKPIIFFGHSLGAVLAFELTRTMCKKDNASVIGLVVSGSPSPWDNRQKYASGLSDDDFIRRISEFAGYSHSALEDPVMREILLPVLRADVEMHENYQPLGDELLSIPILTIRGCDDELVTHEDKQLWRKATISQTQHKEFSGGHMYLINSPIEIMSLIENMFIQNLQ